MLSPTISPSPEACLFVANLPAQYSNEELSFRLLETFKIFGRIASIKASRDAKGRPFGFVQFERVEDASFAVKTKSTLTLCGRRIRIEKARCLRKLQITLPDFSLTLAKIQELLQSFASPEDIIFINNDEDSSVNCFPVEPPSLIIKLFDTINADHSFSQIQSTHPDWKLEWLNANSESNSSFKPSYYHPRSFGIGNEISTNGTHCRRRYNSHDDTITRNQSKKPENVRFSHPVHLPQSSNEMDEITQSLQEVYVNDVTANDVFEPQGSSNEEQDNNVVSVRHSDFHKYSNSEELPNEIFVGRLNSQKVDEDMVHLKFSKYGELVSVHMVNKRTSGIPQDAFAFITFLNHNDAAAAIEKEHGKTWMGQAIKVSWAMPKPQSSSLRSPLPVSMIQMNQPIPSPLVEFYPYIDLSRPLNHPHHLFHTVAPFYPPFANFHPYSTLSGVSVGPNPHIGFYPSPFSQPIPRYFTCSGSEDKDTGIDSIPGTCSKTSGYSNGEANGTEFNRISKKVV